MARQIIVNSENKSINITVEARSNIEVTTSRAVITNGVITQIIPGNNIQVSTVGTVATVSTTDNITANSFYGNLIGNVVGNIVVPGVQWDILYNDSGNAGASSNFKFDATSNVLTIVGNVIANRFQTTTTGSAVLYNTTLAGADTTVTGNINVADTISGDYITGSRINITGNANVGGNLTLTSSGSAGTANVYILKVREQVDSNLTPNVSLVYNLGNSTYRWNRLYVNDQISFGNSQSISADASRFLMTTKLYVDGSDIYNITAANITGQVGNSLVASTVYTNAQPNITSVGTLTNVSVTGNVAAGNVKTNNLLYANGSPYQFTTNAAGSNTYVQFNNDNSFGGNSQFTYDKNLDILTVGYISANAHQLYDIEGANVIGTVNDATTADTVTTNAQPNITSVGTLTDLTIAGLTTTQSIVPSANISYDLGNNTNRFRDLYLANNTIYLGDIQITASAGGLSLPNANITTDIVVGGNATIAGNLTVSGTTEYTNVNNLYIKDPLIEIGGSANNQPLTTNDGKDRGELLHYYTTEPVDAFIGWDNSNGEFALGSNVSSSDNVVTFNTFGNLRAQHIYANINGSNVVGEVAYAATANSVAGANVSGAVNYATTANSVAGANVSGAVAYATTANSVSGSNVSGAVAYASIANSVAGANVSGEVSFAATANSVAGANVSGVVANATFATTSGTTNSVAGANVSGAVAYAATANSVAGANVSGAVAYATTANSVAGANVSGQVSNALVAGTVYTNAQPNITSVGSLVTLDVDGDILGHANISGDYFLGNGAFLTGVGNFSAAIGYHGSFFSNVTQTIASTTTAYPITLNNTSPGTYGVFVASNSRVTFTYAGTYNIQYSIQFTNTDNDLQDASVWLRKNGVDVPDSTSVFGVTARRGAINGQLIGAINYIEDVNANDYYELIWQAENISVSLEYIAPGTTPTSPAAPSVIVTAMQVTNVQAATLSGNLTGNLIGNSYGLTGVSFVNINGNIQGDHFIGNGSGLTSITGANITGQVGNALVAGTVYTNAQPNITSVGTLTSLNVSSSINATSFTSNVATGTAPFIVSSTTQVANLTVAFANIANTANSVAGANVSGQVGNALIAGTVYTAAQGNITSVGTLTGLTSGGIVDFTTTSNVTLGAVANLHISGGTNGYVLSTNGTGGLNWVAQSGGGGTPGGNTTELQFNNAGSFGGINGVTYASGNLTLGAVANVKITGGSSNLFMRTDGAGNLSFQAITSNLTVGTRSVAVNIGISNYTMNVEARTGNVTVNVN